MAEGGHSGGCACGNIRYEISGEPGFSYFCQCRRCQQITGGGHSAAMQIGREQLRVSGTPRKFVDGSEAGFSVTTEFCGDCGSSLFSSTERFPDKINIFAGSLDDPSIFKPTTVVFQSAAQAWDHMNPNLG